jgi:hypothetical protein
MPPLKASAAHWDLDQRALYKRMRRYMQEHQVEFTETETEVVAPKLWRQIARNAAIYAAHNRDVDQTSGETRPASLAPSVDAADEWGETHGLSRWDDTLS